MAGTVHIVMRLLLLSLIPTGVHGENDLVFAKKGYIRYSCEDMVCIRQFSIRTNEYITIVSYGKIQTHKSEYDGSECTLDIKDLTVGDIGRQRCRQNDFSANSIAPVLNVMPGKRLSLQCTFLTYGQRRCSTKQQKQALMWVDEAGAKIQGSQYQIKEQSPCNTTLTVTFRSPENKKFRCQATVDGEVHTSVEWNVRVPALKGRGRGFIKDVDTKPQGGNGDVVGAAVGVVSCVALIAMVALFVVKRRRTNSQLPDESSYTTSANNDMDTDDVIYADIVFPVGSNRVCVHEWDSTEYACIQYK